MKKLLMLVVVLILISVASWAQDIGTGQWLHDFWPSAQKSLNQQTMNGLEEFRSGVFSGFVQGAATVMHDAGWLALTGLSVGQWIAVVGKYLDGNPEQWNLPADRLVFRALYAVWPGTKAAPYQ